MKENNKHLFIFDEADAIPDEIYKKIDNIIEKDNKRINILASRKRNCEMIKINNEDKYYV